MRRLVPLVCLLVLGLIAPAAHAARSALMPDGSVVLWDRFSNVNLDAGLNPPDLEGLARVGADGQVLPGFGRNGFALWPPTPRFAFGIAVDDEGRVMVAKGGGSEIGLRRYLPNGAVDVAFGDVSVPVNDVLPTDSFAVPGGGLLLVGTRARVSPTLRVLALTADGRLDEQFGNHGEVVIGENEAACSGHCHVRRYDDGRMLAGGEWGVVRLNADGTHDDTFGENGAVHLDRPSEVAPLGNGAVAVGELGAPGRGIAVQRLTADGSPAPGFGTGGTVELPLDSSSEEPEVWYTVGDVLALPNAIAVAAVRHEMGSSGPAQCEQRTARLILVTASGTLDHVVDGGFGELDHLMPGPGGSVIATGVSETNGACGRFPEHSHSGLVERLDADFALADRDTVLPVLQPPGLAITGDAPRFRLEVTPGPQDAGHTDLLCALDGAALAPCGADVAVDGQAAGPHELRARVIGVHGATADASRTWTVSTPTPTPSPTASPGPSPTPAANPVVRLVRRGGKLRLTVRAPAGTQVTISPRLRIGGRPRHRLKARELHVGATGVRRVTIRLDRRARRLVRAAERAVRLRVRIVLIEPGGARLVRVRSVRLTPLAR